MTDQYIGVDLHKAFLQVCAVDAAGTRLWERRFERSAAGLTEFAGRCGPRSAVAVEASTPTWHFADVVGAAVGTLTIVDPLKTRLKAGYAAKTDRLDAYRLADALRRDSVVSIYYPPVAIRELRELCRSRHALVKARTTLINQLRAVLLRQGIADARRLARTPDDTWVTTFALPPRAAASIVTLREVLTTVRRATARVEAEVRQVAATDPIAQQLQTLRGIGPLLAVMIRAEIGEVHRFPTGGASRELRGLGAARRRECRAAPHRADHQARVTVAALGVDRSGDPRDAADRSRGALGPQAGGAQRGAESAGGAGAGAV